MSEKGSSPMIKLNMKQQEKLIDLVQSSPHLYDATLTDHRNKLVAKNTWKKIAREMDVKGLGADHCKLKWKNVKDGFNAKRKKINESTRSGSAAKVIHTGPFYKRLHFLLGHVAEASTVSNLQAPVAAATDSPVDEPHAEQDSGHNNANDDDDDDVGDDDGDNNGDYDDNVCGSRSSQVCELDGPNSLENSHAHQMMAYLYRRQRHRIRMMQYMMQRQQKRKHRFWIHEIIRKRDECGSYRQLVQELQLDSEKHHRYFRMSAAKLDFVLNFVGPVIQKQRRAREPIEAKQRLAICIRFLATGESYTSLATQYRVGLTTVSRLVPEVCDAIWETMRGTFLKMPQTPDDWKVIALDFEEKWNFPHCVGALDGKHVVIKAPMNSGSMFYNYKSSFSVVLMALTDASNRFICVDIGAYGRQSDAGIFSNSAMGRAFLNPNTLNLPNAEPIHGAEYIGPMPYVAVGDEAFPLQQHIMRPYPGQHSSLDEDAYNYRHTRARRIVECCFGILATRWRVFYTRLSIQPGNVIKVVQGAIVLHNMLQTDSTQVVSTAALLSDFRMEDVQGFEDLDHHGNRGSADAVNVRNRFKRLFVGNPLPWQNAHIQRGLH